MKKTTQFRKMIESSQLEFIMEAHSGISAKIVEEAGFKGIWASGLSISAALGHRDNNELSWTQVLDVCEYMADATTIPILLDGDTGFGNFNSFRLLVNKLEQRGIAGVCIEDKIFPKTNSFISGEKQPLAEIDEFCGKIRCGKDAQTDPDFVIVARVEALIAGWGLDEALKRAHAYADAGADAILIHSKINNPSEIEAFMKQWNNYKPIVIVPTMYYNTPTDFFRELGISLVIWANHSLRASITYMQKIVNKIYTDVSLANIEHDVVTVKEIFRLQNMKDYKEAEDKYLPQKRTFKGLVLAATKGTNFGTLTDDKPKAMITVGNDTILSKIIRTFNARKIKDITVVTGFKAEVINLPNLKTINNPNYQDKGLLYSLYCAKDVFEGDVILSFGDILFEEEVIRKLMHTDEDIVMAVDVTAPKTEIKERDLVKGEKPFSDTFGAVNIQKVVEVKEVPQNSSGEDFNGEFMGLIKLSSAGSAFLRNELTALETGNPDMLNSGTLNDFINYLITKKGKTVHLQYFRGHWKDIDSIEDLTFLINLYSQGASI